MDDGREDAEGPVRIRTPWTRKSVACTNCRKRKSRCSGQPCEFCLKYGYDCVVEPLAQSASSGTTQRTSKRRYITPETDEARKQRRVTPTGQQPHLPQPQPASYNYHRSQSVPTVQTFAPMAGEVAINEPATNAMGQPLSLCLLPSSSKSSPFYGSSSALSFAKVIIAAALPNFSLPAPDLHEASADGSRLPAHTTGTEDATDLPMRSVADGMIENFFRRSHGQSTWAPSVSIVAEVCLL